MYVFIGSPGVLLRDILYGASEPIDAHSGNNEQESPRLLKAPDVKQLLAALQSHEMTQDKGKNPASLFILQLYRKLQAGESLIQASGLKTTSLNQADTVRTFTALGKIFI